MTVAWVFSRRHPSAAAIHNMSVRSSVYLKTKKTPKTRFFCHHCDFINTGKPDRDDLMVNRVCWRATSGRGSTWKASLLQGKMIHGELERAIPGRCALTNSSVPL